MSISSIYACLTTTPSFSCFWQVAQTAITEIENAAETFKDGEQLVNDVASLDFKQAVSDAKEVLDDGREILVDAGVDASQVDSMAKAIGTAFIDTVGEATIKEATDIVEKAEEEAQQSVQSSTILTVVVEAVETVREGEKVVNDLTSFNLQQAEADAKTALGDAEKTLVDGGVDTSIIDTVTNAVEQAATTAIDDTIGQAAAQAAVADIEQVAQVVQDVQQIADDASGNNVADVVSDLDQALQDATSLIQVAAETPAPYSALDSVEGTESDLYIPSNTALTQEGDRSLNDVLGEVRKYSKVEEDEAEQWIKTYPIPKPLSDVFHHKTGDDESGNAASSIPDRLEESGNNDASTAVPTEPVLTEYTEPESVVATTTPEPTPLAGESTET